MEEALWFGALEAKLNHHQHLLPPRKRKPRLLLAQALQSGVCLQCAAGPGSLYALPFGQVVLCGDHDSLPPVTLGWDVGGAAGAADIPVLWGGQWK